jgi:hypothetical protein
MSGEHRLSPEGYSKPSLSAFRPFALLVLAALAIIVTLMFPEIQLQPTEFIVGP